MYPSGNPIRGTRALKFMAVRVREIRLGWFRNGACAMISRYWHGAVPSHMGDAFDQHFNNNVLAEIAALTGNLGVFVKRRAFGGYDHFFLVSYWDTWDSIRAFAGDRPHIAVHYLEDERFGLIADPIVLHQQCTTVDPWFGQ